MGKRKRDKEKDEDYIRKKIKKLQEKLSENSRTTVAEAETDRDPDPDPVVPADLSTEILDDDEIPEEFLLALGTEGQENENVGEPLRPELASRWAKLMCEGLNKDARELILKKYPTPANFPGAVAPIINPEIRATLSEPSVKRDTRIVSRQNVTGTLMTCLGRALTDIFKGNINTKHLIEQINDAAKLAADIHHQDSGSRKFFCLAGANKTVQDAVRQQKTDRYLFGEDCAEKIKAAQTIQKTSSTIKTNTEKDKKQPKQSANNKNKLNWKSPPQGRGGQQYRQPRKHYNQPHRKEKQSTFKPKSRYQR